MRFNGDMTKDAARALRTARMGRQRRDTFFAEPLPYSTTVVLLAEGPDDAIAQVRAALSGHGDFAGFEVTPFSESAGRRSTT